MLLWEDGGGEGQTAVLVSRLPRSDTSHTKATKSVWGGGGVGRVAVAAGRLDGWCVVTVAHALVHGIRGTVGNRLFRL